MTDAATLALIVAGLSAPIILAIRFAPEGYQDDAGFHRGTPHDRAHQSGEGNGAVGEFLRNHNGGNA